MSDAASAAHSLVFVDRLLFGHQALFFSFLADSFSSREPVGARWKVFARSFHLTWQQGVDFAGRAEKASVAPQSKERKLQTFRMQKLAVSLCKNID